MADYWEYFSLVVFYGRRIGGEIQVHMPHSLVSPNSYKKRKEKHIERHETRLEGECLYRLYYDYTMYEADILIKGSCTKYIIYPILQSKLDIISKYIVLLIVKNSMLIPL